jgi:hypothetical protein
MVDSGHELLIGCAACRGINGREGSLPLSLRVKRRLDPRVPSCRNCCRRQQKCCYRPTWLWKGWNDKISWSSHNWFNFYRLTLSTILAMPVHVVSHAYRCIRVQVPPLHTSPTIRRWSQLTHLHVNAFLTKFIAHYYTAAGKHFTFAQLHFRVNLLSNFCYSVRLVVFTAVTMKNCVFWDVTPCGACKNRRFGGTKRLLHQGDKNRWTRNNTSCN